MLGGRPKWAAGSSVSLPLRSRIAALGALAAAVLAILNPSFGLWWGFPLAATAVIALLLPYRGSLVALASASILLALTGLPAWGRQERSLSIALGVVGLVAGVLALTGRVGVGAGSSRRAALSPGDVGAAVEQALTPDAPSVAASVLAGLGLVAGLAGAATLLAVLGGLVMIVPWMEMALGLVQTGLAFAAGAALSGARMSRGGRASAVVALLVSLVSLAPMVWMLFLAP